MNAWERFGIPVPTASMRGTVISTKDAGNGRHGSEPIGGKFVKVGGNNMSIKDSGNRTEFESGAVRDMQEGKGRCDLLPLDIVAEIELGAYGRVFGAIERFQNTGDVFHLFKALDTFADVAFGNFYTMLLEVAKHFEEGAKKYSPNNWKLGINVEVYINSGVRHLLKWLRNDDDEPHDRAFCWNIVCAIWTCRHLPHLNDYAVKESVSGD